MHGRPRADPVRAAAFVRGSPAHAAARKRRTRGRRDRDGRDGDPFAARRLRRRPVCGRSDRSLLVVRDRARRRRPDRVASGRHAHEAAWLGGLAHADRGRGRGRAADREAPARAARARAAADRLPRQGTARRATATRPACRCWARAGTWSTSYPSTTSDTSSSPSRPPRITSCSNRQALPRARASRCRSSRRLFEVEGERVSVARLGALPLVTTHYVDPKGWQFKLKYARRAGRRGARARRSRAPLLARRDDRRPADHGRPGDLSPEANRQRRPRVRDAQAPHDERQSRGGMARRTSTGPLGSSRAERPAPRADLRARRPRRRPADRASAGCCVTSPWTSFPSSGTSCAARCRWSARGRSGCSYVRRFEHSVYRYGERHRVKSGITGWAQVNGLRGRTSLSDRVEWDNYYIENWSPWLDIKIILHDNGVRACAASTRKALRDAAPRARVRQPLILADHSGGGTGRASAPPPVPRATSRPPTSTWRACRRAADRNRRGTASTEPARTSRHRCSRLARRRATSIGTLKKVATSPRLGAPERSLADARADDRACPRRR